MSDCSPLQRYLCIELFGFRFRFGLPLRGRLFEGVSFYVVCIRRNSSLIISIHSLAVRLAGRYARSTSPAFGGWLRIDPFKGGGCRRACAGRGCGSFFYLFCSFFLALSTTSGIIKIVKGLFFLSLLLVGFVMSAFTSTLSLFSVSEAASSGQPLVFFGRGRFGFAAAARRRVAQCGFSSRVSVSRTAPSPFGAVSRFGPVVLVHVL